MWLQRWQLKRDLERLRPGFVSRFGGLWPDRKNSSSLNQNRPLPWLQSWREQGFVCFPNAVSHADCDDVLQDMSSMLRPGSPGLIERGGITFEVGSQELQPGDKLLDLYAHSPAARKATFSATAATFLTELFEGDALAFQGLSFNQGSVQDLHQDTAYVVVNSPLEFVASWLALEDVKRGSGELRYMPGSHRIEEFLFDGKRRSWNRKKDGDASHQQFLNHLVMQCERKGLREERFLARKGDLFFWHAELVHGGSPITLANSTRKSLVTHFCPARCFPYYAGYSPRAKQRFEHQPGRWFSSKWHSFA
ncbi:MAG: phytanoyl-CoA dioxygenase family protein [Planctomycetota bacterium]